MFDGGFTEDLIEKFGRPYKVQRRAAGIYQKGRAVAGKVTELEIIAVVQPASGRDLLRLPEARRATETRRIDTTTQLVVGGEGSPTRADLIVIDGSSWEVQSVQAWPGYFRCLAQAPAILARQTG